MLCQSIVRGTGVPHATAYAVMGPVVLAAMVRAAPGELAPLVRALSGGDEPGEAVARLTHLAEAGGVTRLGQAGVGERDLAAVAALAAARRSWAAALRRWTRAAPWRCCAPPSE